MGSGGLYSKGGGAVYLTGGTIHIEGSIVANSADGAGGSISLVYYLKPIYINICIIH